MLLRMSKSPFLIKGGSFQDERGRLDFVNDFNLESIKRMYFTTNANVGEFRGWQGHEIECRWFYCVHGAFEIKLVRIDDWENPSSNPEMFTFELSEEQPEVLYVPGGFANGFSSLKENSKIMMMSDYGMGELLNDEIRFESNKWN